ncbi:MAG TPA: type II toxin-antitoxin system prevent-host-death family antitoxin [Polyangiaceae bacterium]|nr:type II toxin-antitoxin system prevent-host-death family antitoxin [Polyangiaceae bacterium]
MTSSLAVAELKAHLADALRRVEAGERIVVERRGKPIAVLVPAAEASEGGEWWRHLYGVAADIDDFESVMRDVVKSRRTARPRPVDLEK